MYKTIKDCPTHYLLEASRRFETMICCDNQAVYSFKRFRARRCLRACQKELNRRIDGLPDWPEALLAKIDQKPCISIESTRIIELKQKKGK